MIGWSRAKPWLALAALAGLAVSGPAQPAAAQVEERQDEPQPGEADFTALTSGPMHEAFAEVYNKDPVPGIIVSEAPPEPVDEVPPEARPEGENVEWIPGYWAWDDGEKQFIWISGVWRELPPEQQWVPGYWTRVEDGWQWIAGFWVGEEQGELSYLPTPPRSLEEGPSGPRPSENHFWVPGVWIFVEQEADFRWRPGHWAEAHTDWVWVPDRYVWTPYGCIFVAGHWDHVLVERGVLFAPVVFHAAPVRFFTPTVVIDVGPTLLVHLFVRPAYCHYYFGDFYADHYQRNFGIVPWFAHFHDRPRFYDPLFVFYRWNFDRRGADFARIGGWHRFYSRNEDFRPRRTFRESREFATRHRDEPRARLATFSTSFDDVVSDRERRFERLERPRRTEIARRAERMAQLRERRIELETRRAARADDDPRRRRGPAERRLRLQDTARRDAQPGERPDVRRPDERPERPDVRRPGERPERPDVRRPGERPEQPDVRRPGDRPERPDVRRPDERPERPDVRRPGERPERPDVRRPGERPERPDVRRPGERPDVRRPGEQPGRPDVRRPETPRERPGIRRPETHGERPGVRRPETPGQRPGIRRPETPGERPGVRQPQSPRQRPEFRGPEGSRPGTRGPEGAPGPDLRRPGGPEGPATRRPQGPGPSRPDLRRPEGPAGRPDVGPAGRPDVRGPRGVPGGPDRGPTQPPGAGRPPVERPQAKPPARTPAPKAGGAEKAAPAKPAGKGKKKER